MSQDGFKSSQGKTKYLIILLLYILFSLSIIFWIVILGVRRGYVENGYKNESWLNNNQRQICFLSLCLSPAFSLVNSAFMELKFNGDYKKSYYLSHIKTLFLVFIISILYYFSSSILLLSIGTPFSVISFFVDVLLDIRFLKQLKGTNVQ